jgi:hypothetical protein
MQPVEEAISLAKGGPVMLSNVEPLAREMTLKDMSPCWHGRSAYWGLGRPHWTCAAAMLEAGVMDEAGEWIPDKDLRRGLAAYREKVAIT